MIRKLDQRENFFHEIFAIRKMVKRYYLLACYHTVHGDYSINSVKGDECKYSNKNTMETNMSHEVFCEDEEEDGIIKSVEYLNS